MSGRVSYVAIGTHSRERRRKTLAGFAETLVPPGRQVRPELLSFLHSGSTCMILAYSVAVQAVSAVQSFLDHTIEPKKMSHFLALTGVSVSRPSC